MTDLEIVLGIALVVMLFIWQRQMYQIRYYRAIIVSVGLGHSRVEIDDEDKKIHIKDNKKQQITNP
jgi:hypothetical protein